MKTDITEHIGKPVFLVKVPRGEDGRWTPQMWKKAPPFERISKHTLLTPGDYIVRRIEEERCDCYLYHRIKSISKKQVSIYREVWDERTNQILLKTAVFRRILAENYDGDVYYENKTHALFIDKCYIVPGDAKT